MELVSRKWLRRLDAHMERGNELFERNGEAFERNREAFERNREAFERNREAFERVMGAFDRWEARESEHREFMREITARVERGGRAVVAQVEALGAQIEGLGAQIQAQSREFHVAMNDVVEELRAGRGALLAMLDRLEPGDSGSTA